MPASCLREARGRAQSVSGEVWRNAGDVRSRSAGESERSERSRRAELALPASSQDEVRRSLASGGYAARSEATLRMRSDASPDGRAVRRARGRMHKRSEKRLHGCGCGELWQERDRVRAREARPERCQAISGRTLARCNTRACVLPVCATRRPCCLRALNSCFALRFPRKVERAQLALRTIGPRIASRLRSSQEHFGEGQRAPRARSSRSGA